MNQIQIHNGIAYKILKTQTISHFCREENEHPNMDYVEAVRDWVGSDHVLRTPTHFLFCETITEVDFEIVE